MFSLKRRGGLWESMIFKWREKSKFGKVCFLSSLLFFTVGVVWLIYDLSSGNFSFFKSQATFYIILGIVFLIAFSTSEDKNNKANDHITLDNIQNKMSEMDFTNEFIAEIVTILEEEINTNGIKEFQKWFNELNYKLPNEFKDEALVINIYEIHPLLIEKEIKKLEKETKLSWEKQTEDLIELNDKARKAQLVIRHRLSDIALELNS